MSENDRKYDFEECLVGFAVRIIHLSESLPKSKGVNHIAGQIIRGGTYPAFNYGEAQSEECCTDFIHKMKICLKNL
ncbi:MAG: four helix bundle protein [Deltaproteobacteria bacterium]|nr:four helix bundle protein [Deltaproteobacteria bacterium]